MGGLEEVASFTFAELPDFPASTVPGHEGRLILGRLGGTPLALFLGRIHFYEHREMEMASLTVRLARRLGAQAAILTASVGGVDPDLEPGSIVIVDDHINFMGVNPLAGWRRPDGSPAFVDLSSAYDPVLAGIAEASAQALGLWVSRGVYAALPGPSYETPAEVEFLRRSGATVVGMSMVPEAAAASAMGMRVLGLCAVVNAAGSPIAHTQVVEEGERAAVAAGKLLAAILPRLA